MQIMLKFLPNNFYDEEHDIFRMKHELFQNKGYYFSPLTCKYKLSHDLNKLI